MEEVLTQLEKLNDKKNNVAPLIDLLVRSPYKSKLLDMKMRYTNQTTSRLAPIVLLLQ